MLVGHKKQWEFLKSKFENNQLSHAYLFTGPKGIGKKLFAKEFSEFIGCKFPDFMLVGPEGGKEIPISKIREVQNFLSYKSYYSSAYKSVIVDSAEKMNREAQSCFLKTLEEPKGKTLLILISSKPDMLLPTIFSRCQTIKFLGKPILSQAKIDEEKKLLRDMLDIAGRGFSEKFKYVKLLDIEQQKFSDMLEILQKYLRYLLFSKIGAGQLAEQKYFSDVPDVFKNYPVSKIKKIINLSEEINSKIIFANANPKLAMEILLMEL